MQAASKIDYEICYNNGGAEKELGAQYGLTASGSKQTVTYNITPGNDADLVLQMSLGNAAGKNTVTISGVSHGPVAVVVPKMDFTTELDLKGVFTYFKFPLNGFERMDRSMRPGAVRQRVRLRLDEQGLDPAPLMEKPADAVVHGDADTPRFILNRPFLFFVYHEPTGTIPVAGQFTGM